MDNNQKNIQENELKKILESGLILSKEDKSTLDAILHEANQIISKEAPKEEQKKNEEFSRYRETMMKYGKVLSEIKYTFGLKEEEYKLLRKIIFQELEYDRQDLFVALVVKENFFDEIENQEEWHENKFKDGIEYFKVDIHNITRISHLIGKYKIKGLNKKASNYAEIIRKIGDISKIFEHYNQLGNKTSEAGGNWIQGLEENGSNSESGKEEKVLVDKKVKPKSKSNSKNNK